MARFEPLDSISEPGDDIWFWTSTVPIVCRPLRNAMRSSSVRARRACCEIYLAAVIGCSGTGSPVVEQLARLGVGRLVLVDPDCVEEKNLNRILNATREDAYLRRPKVEVMARAIARMGFGTEVEIIPENLASPRAVRAVAECDIVFGWHGRGGGAPPPQSIGSFLPSTLL